MTARRKRGSEKKTNGNGGGGCLLTYLPSTFPSTVQVSTSQTPMQAIVNTAALNQSGSPVYCNQVLIAVPIGTAANELFAAFPAPTAAVNTGKWAITSMVVKHGRELGLDTDVDYATFTFQCRDQSDFLINYNLVFGLQGRVSLLTGDSEIMIGEQSGTSSDPNTFTLKRTSYTVTAYTPQFYLQNFVATVPTAPTVPASEFANGANIRLSWESNGTFFQIYEKNNPMPIYSGSQTVYTMAGGVATDTTFVLVAMMTGNPATGSAQGGFAPIYLYEEVTVTISNPDLKPKSSTIAGNAHVGGTFGVTGKTTLSNASLSGTLGVSGQTNLGNANVGGTLGVSGQTNLTNAIVGGTLTASGSSTLSNTAVNGTLGVSGAASFSGGLFGTNSPVGIMTAAQGVNPGSFVAHTDGLVIGAVSWPANPDLYCMCWIIGNTNGIVVAATGGNHGAFANDWTKWRASNGNTFMFPVSKGNRWSLGVAQAPSNEIAAPTSFYWVPLGTAANGNTFERVSDEQPEFKVSEVHRRPVRNDEYIRELVATIEAIFDKPIERMLRKRLINVLTKMQVEEYENESYSGDD
ncbi:MAG: hypothetical protein H7Y30_09005 [Pyrinomonadaceae bacterium]|nr:hypothetical protein [Pyrinomonadaceae bacterium]